MLPGLQEGDRVLVRYGASPAPGRVHLVRLPPGPHGPRPLAIKRLTRSVDGGWWVVSDNPAEGTDSRTVGPVPTCDVVAKIVVRLPRPGGPLGKRGR